MNTRPTFQISQDSRLLIMTLKAAGIGDIITDRQLEDAIGKSLRDAPGPLQTAFKRLMRDENMVFGRIRKVGYQRLADSQIVASGASDAERIRRQANRSVERQMKVDFDRLTTADKTQFTTQVSVMGSIAMMTKPKSLARVADAASKAGRPELPISETLRMFANKEKPNADE